MHARKLRVIWNLISNLGDIDVEQMMTWAEDKSIKSYRPEANWLFTGTGENAVIWTHLVDQQTLDVMWN